VLILVRFGYYGRRQEAGEAGEAGSVVSCHAFKLGMGSEQDAKPAAWLR